MEQLWSPWRSSYIAASAERSASGCFLCAAAKEDADALSVLVVARFPSTIIVLNRYPYNAGHLLIAPSEHIADLTDVERNNAHELMDVTQMALRVLERELHPHGVNVGVNLGSAAGAGVPGHLHIHLVPRWNGDTNFMPVIGEVKVVSERLDEMWQRFTEAFREVASV
ncbi:MAG: HIT domain-containing protein [Ignavibacteria bacterium]|nr:HIT domain-containing protein [Ignavibacteria bacterium]MBP6509483.1 HIT domain-containing protein [Candidatus Kapabacteria bacterium]MBK6418608.1 HIT domain-containing protein [Ignavibacteria bacterium]MBK6760573.1 HIT domain-containing protein [Ignavibacteria bacterium]MBK7185987.1 HIT domain-containing protein [Ignavibacteria bacterium]